MNYLVDTNVISELVRANPSPAVIAWFEAIPVHTLFLSVLTLGEIRKGVERVKDKPRKMKLLLWLEHDLTAMFESRVLLITEEVSDRWGRLLAQTQRTLPAIDSLIAATALHHDMVLVTRNSADFEGCLGLEVMNPWVI